MASTKLCKGAKFNMLNAHLALSQLRHYSSQQALTLLQTLLRRSMRHTSLLRCTARCVQL
jgi:hypothetical protein